jgi:surface polysaccharide O-acyltransferase-like enzyme
MKNQSGPDSSSRMFFLDNIRIYLTILVILHHAALAYGGMGGWAIRDPMVDDISPIFLTIFNAINQSYFMTAFFLLAGYFTPRSLEKKKGKQFLSERLIRLGIPILIYTTLIININQYIISIYGAPFQPVIAYEPGHLWFLQLLLLFAVIYVLYKWLVGRFPRTLSIQIYRENFPPDSILLFSIVILSILTFILRLVLPVGETIRVLNIQPAHVSHYVFAFFVGVLAYRGDWFRRLTREQGRRWGLIALVVLPLLFVIMILGGVLESDENLVKFLGGFHWQSLVYAVWETFMMVGVIVFLLYFFRERFNQAGSVAKIMAASVFTVYIIHQVVLYFLNTLFLPVSIPTIVKFILVSLIAVPLCFLLSIPIRKIPYADRVL